MFNAFPLPLFQVLVFSGLLSVHWISFVFFLYDRNFCTHSLKPLFLTPCEFEAWNWFWYLLTCGLRGGVEAHMEQKSGSKYLPWPEFEPWTSRLAVQHATARPPYILSCVNQVVSSCDNSHDLAYFCKKRRGCKIVLYPPAHTMRP